MNTFTFFVKSITTGFISLKARKISFTIFILVVFLLAMKPDKVNAQSDGDYHSVGLGSWEDPASWERFNGSTWEPALVSPTYTDGVINIGATTNISINQAITVDQVVVEANATLSAFAIVELLDGPGNDLEINGTAFWGGPSGLIVAGNAFVSGTTNQFQYSGATMTNNGTIAVPVAFTGSGLQTIAGTGTLHTLLTANIAGVSLQGDQTITELLNFNSGNVNTGANKLIIAAGAQPIQNNSGTQWYVNGNLQINFSGGTSTKDYRIGDGSGYRPVSLTLNDVSGTGGVAISTINTDHPDIGNSLLDEVHNVERYWSFTNNGLAFSQASVTLTWGISELDETSSVPGLRVAKLDASNWTYPNTSNPTNTSININGITSFSDFQVGELNTNGLEYRTSTSGPWNAAAVWEFQTGPGTWVPAPSAPDYNAGTISVLHDINVSGYEITIDQLEVKEGGILTALNSTIRFYSEGSNPFITIENDGLLNVNSTTLDGNGVTTTVTVNGGPSTVPNLVFSDESSLTGVNIENAGICHVNAGTLVLGDNTGINNTHILTVSGDIDLNGSGATITNNGITNFYGTHQLIGSSESYISNGSDNTNANLNVWGNLTLDVELSNNGNLIVSTDNGATDGKLNITHEVNNYSGTITTDPGAEITGLTVNFAGTSITNAGKISVFELIFGGGEAQTLAGNGEIQVLTMNNAAGLTLAGNPVVYYYLHFGTGRINTNGNKIILDTEAIADGADDNSYVNGNLQRNYTPVSTPLPYDIGDPDSYLPVTITPDIITAGGITARTDPEDHFNISNSNLIPDSSVHRTWKLERNGIQFNSCTVTFTFGTFDYTAINYQDFKVAKFDDSIWEYPSGSNATETSVTVNVNSFSDFQVGQLECIVDIPDANFKTALLANALINTNSNSEIECSEAAAYTGDIFVQSQGITSLAGLEAFTSVTSLICADNNITTLDLSLNPGITQVSASVNQINNINVANNAGLFYLALVGNELETIDVSNNPLLQNLYLGSNDLTDLDVSANTALTGLDVSNNHFPSLDLSTNTALEQLIAYNNQLTSLDLSANTDLTQIQVNNNLLTSLNVQNGNNSNVTNANFSALNNPGLSCIQVDDVVYSNANWTNIDPGTTFSANCSLPPGPLKYQSAVAGGEWTNATTWEVYNGSVWVQAIDAPDGTNSDTITIRGGFDVVSGFNFSADQLIIEVGASLVVSGEANMTILDGAGDDLYCEGTIHFTSAGMINSGVAEFLNGSFLRMHTFSYLDGNGVYNLRAGSTTTIDDNGGHDFAGGCTINNYGEATWEDNGPLFMDGTNTTFNNYGTFEINANNNIISGLPATPVINNMASGTLRKNASEPTDISSNIVFSNYGSVEIEGGGININNGNGVHSGIYAIGSGAELAGGVDLHFTGASLTNFGNVRGLNFIFEGTAAQNYYSAEGTIDSVVINNAAGVILNADMNIGGKLQFINGKITTGNFVVSPGQFTVVSGASATAYVNGKMRRSFDDSFTGRSYDIGDATRYAPVTVTLELEPESGADVTISTAQGDHTDIDNSGLNPAKTVNRTWHMESQGEGILGVGVNFNWNAADVDGTANFSNFIVKKYDVGPGWEALNSYNRTATSIGADNFITFSDFQVGEPASTTPAAALNFDGINDIAQHTGPVIPVINNPFTVSVWAKQDAYTPGQLKVMIAQGRHFYIGQNFDNTIRIGDDWYTNLPWPTDLNWHNYTVVRTYDNTYFYFDGALTATKGDAIPVPDETEGLPTTQNFYVGSQWDTGEPWNGSIDELRVWARGLCAVEISANYQCEISVATTGVIAAFNFNQGIASGNNAAEDTVTDASGFGNIFTLNNFALTGNTSNWTAPGGVTTGNSCTPVNTIIYYVDADGDGYGNPLVQVNLGDICPAPSGYVLDNTDCDDNNANLHGNCNVPIITCAPDITICQNNAQGACGVRFFPQTIPAIPVVNILDRAITYTGVSINGGGNAVTLQPGDPFTLNYSFSVSFPPGGYCPGCVVQSNVGIGSTFTTLQCEASISNGSGGARSVNSFAPTTPGIYYITQELSLDYFCQEFKYTNDSARAIGVLIVGPPYPTAIGGTGNITFTNNAPTCFPVGLTQLRWIATDEAGLSDTCFQAINVLPATIYYRDRDGDGFGNPAYAVYACTQPAGFILENTDCNDYNPAIHAGCVCTLSLTTSASDTLIVCVESGQTTGNVNLITSGGTAPYIFTGSDTTNLSPGDYTYYVIDANGCRDTARLHVILTNCIIPYYEPPANDTIQHPDRFRVYAAL